MPLDSRQREEQGNDFENKKKKEREHNAAAIAARNHALSTTHSIFENSSRAIFAAGTTISAVQLAKPILVSADLAQIFGASWNFFDGIASYVSATTTAAKLKTTKTEQARAKKTAWVAMDVLSGTQLNVLTLLTLTAQYNLLALNPALTAAFLPLAALGFAVSAWASLARSITELTLAAKKLNPETLIQDKLERYEHSSCTDEDKERFKQQIIALYRCEKKNERFDTDKSLKNRIIAKFAGSFVPDVKLDAKPTVGDIELVEYLLAKQEQKVAAHAMAVTRWGFSAIGMTLFSIATYLPSDPNLLIAAVLFSAIAGALKLYEIANTIAPIDHLAVAHAAAEDNQNDSGEINALGSEEPDVLDTHKINALLKKKSTVAKHLSLADQYRLHISECRAALFSPKKERVTQDVHSDHSDSDSECALDFSKDKKNTTSLSESETIHSDDGSISDQTLNQ